MAGRFILTATAAACACASAPTTRPEQRFASTPVEYRFGDPERRTKIAATFGAIDSLTDSEAESRKLPSVALGIVVDGELVHFHSYGFADLAKKSRPDADTVYRIGSITKSFTALAILALRDRGRLDLDDPLVRHLPEASGLVYPTRDSQPLTIRQLLTMTSGLPRDGDFEFSDKGSALTDGEILRSLSGFALEYVPGTVFHYSNLGFSLLGLVVARVSGVPYRQFISKEIFGPLGMAGARWDDAEVAAGQLASPYISKAGQLLPASGQVKFGAYESAGGIYASVRNMARYLAFELDAHPARDASEAGPIRRATVRETQFAGTSPALSIGPRKEEKEGERSIAGEATTYAYGWGVSQTCDLDRHIGHNGGLDGYSANVTFLPEHGVGFVVLSNKSDAGALGAITERAIATMAAGGGLAKRTARPPFSAELKAGMNRFWTAFSGKWDEAAFRGMLDRRIPSADIVIEDEKAEFKLYRSINGACSRFEPLEATSPSRGRFILHCERGRLEIDLGVVKDGFVNYYKGRMSEVAPPSWLVEAANTAAAMLTDWSDAAYEAVFTEPRNSRDVTRSGFEKLGKTHGTCKIASMISMESDEAAFKLTCSRGGNLLLFLRHARGSDKPRFVWFRPEVQSRCSVP